MIKWIKKFFKKSTESILVLNPAWEVKPKKKKSPYDEPWNGIV